MVKLTKTIEKILELIEKENVSKTTDFSKRLGITPAGVHRYLKKLRKAKALRHGYSVNYSSFGQIQVMLLLDLFRPADKGIVKEFKSMGSVKKTISVQGDYDYIVFAVFRTEQEMREFMTTVMAFNDKIRNYKMVMLGGEFI